MAKGLRPPAPTRLWGRERECALLEELLAAVRRGESRSLVVRGEAGIGKTALLEHLVAEASGFAVVRATGVESEMELAYAGLQQLCAPMLEQLDGLPALQRDALRVVFGLSSGPAPDRYVVGLAALNLLCEVAERRPLLCVVDDAQWLDRASAFALAFVARRLLAERVGLVFAARVPEDELLHVPSLEVPGLLNADARRLLDATVPYALDRQISERIITETRGNPLALLELPRGLVLTELDGVFGVPTAGGIPERIVDHYDGRVDALPEAARRLLLVAAAEPLGDPLLLVRACERLGIDPDAVDATDGLLTVDERVTFRHPLARSAVYWSADAAQRRGAHLVLAEVTDRDADPDRRAWHLAAAAAGPDEEVARELERSADRAQARGGVAASAAFLRRAVALSSEPARRAERALAAAEGSLRAGAFVVARGLLTMAEAGPLDQVRRARLALLRAQITAQYEVRPDAPLLLTRAAQQLEAVDVRLARDTYLDAWAGALIAGGYAAEGGTLRDVSRAAAAAPQPAGGSLARDLLLDGLALLFAEGRPAAAPVLRDAVAAFLAPGASVEEVTRWGFLASRAANVVWDYDGGFELGRRSVQACRDVGALPALNLTENAWAQSAALGGDFPTAILLTTEFRAVKDVTGSSITPLGELALVGLRGREAEASPLIARLLADATERGQGAAVGYASWARAVLMNGLGRHAEALEAAARASDETPGLFIAAWGLIELVEAAVKTGRRDVAQDALTRLESQTEATPTDWARGVRSRSAALLDDDETGEALYMEAIDRLGRTRLRPDVARAHLLYGEWLRGRQRRVEARGQLRAAYEHFAEIGMEAFAQRARSELEAAGETVRGRADEPRDDLSAQERQIALLARDGLSNQEIGAQLFLSPRTVEWHLRKVFAKLGIRSRRELAPALAKPAAGAP